ncbi:fructose-2,6-bisphosphatase [Xanthomonas nasturtii]|uniref:Histidine phosphatase family protein n=1 Tax=Xanthomonas nasturtii TaxID=1843581 RepID=A0A3E1KNY7_9XANT|nr:histidine phosphatase family protein [Xanthomonas nasturtii]MCL1501388.1 histidine phosphatase family protein [Xanthomonas nasturtii]MCL1505257.1 histidine phosphatase family protein [Xanthomonas nasturtii]MCL1524165.1 histidine phosphatase family protein [Xanthomonas nasturtii]MCL1525781.1 histidine phosphatase family protein [Xanthomonas nasturtii]MCL1530158.1 histidine phosphatase family protein [Xanthomonas nasturtii]
MSAQITLLRHGDTGQRSYRGQLDDPLTELGWQQLRAATAEGVWDAVVASTLQRCAKFAAELAQARAIPLQLDPRLREYHFGRWQGVPVADIDRDEGAALGRFWADPVRHPPPQAEPFADFCARLSAALDAIVTHHPAQRVLVVTHGGAIRALRCMVEARPFGSMTEMAVPHASLHPLKWPLASADAMPTSQLSPVPTLSGRDAG